MRHQQTPPAGPSPNSTLTLPARIEQMLAEAPLLPVVDAAAAIGISIGARTSLRWSINGRAGERLTTIRVRGRLCTTVPELRRWFAATAARQEKARCTPAAPGLDQRGADKVLDAYQLGRSGDNP